MAFADHQKYMVLSVIGLTASKIMDIYKILTGFRELL